MESPISCRALAGAIQQKTASAERLGVSQQDHAACHWVAEQVWAISTWQPEALTDRGSDEWLVCHRATGD
jgi:hypothetical protein